MHVFVIFNRLVKRVINYQYHFNKEKIKDRFTREKKISLSHGDNILFILLLISLLSTGRHSSLINSSIVPQNQTAVYLHK